MKEIGNSFTVLKIYQCPVDNLKQLENGQPIECPTTLSLIEGEELIAKYKERVAAILFKDGSFLKVRRKLNT